MRPMWCAKHPARDQLDSRTFPARTYERVTLHADELQYAAGVRAGSVPAGLDPLLGGAEWCASSAGRDAEPNMNIRSPL